VHAGPPAAPASSTSIAPATRRPATKGKRCTNPLARAEAVVRLELIVARARNGVIGDRGALPWRLPEDLAHFKRTTLGHPVVMGRRTWDSIGRALPGRRNIVVTRNPAWQAPGAEAAPDLAAALALCDGGDAAPPARVFLIGGAQLYAQALAGHVDAIHLTEIDADFAGDARFPALEPGRWRETLRTRIAADAGRPYAFDFVHYEAADPHGGARPPGDPDAQR
jgi:dihydrofolate reductase